MQSCSLTRFSAASRGLPPTTKHREINHVAANVNTVPYKNIELVSIPRPPKVYLARCDSGVNQNNLTKIKTVRHLEPREVVIRCGLLNVRSLSSKSLLINDLITETRCDVFCLSETWLQEGEYVSLNEATPPGYVNYHIPRSTGRGGGVAAVYNSSLQVKTKPKCIYNTFESLTLRARSSTSCYALLSPTTCKFLM